MTYIPSRSDLLLYEFKISKSKRRLSKYGIVFHIPTNVFFIEGLPTTFDDEAEFLRTIQNRKARYND